MNKYYVYAFLDESKPGRFIYDGVDFVFDYEPFYIGKGTEDRIKSSQSDRECQFKVNKIRKIKRLGGEIIAIKLFENLGNQEALNMEMYIIPKIGRRDNSTGPLVNLTNGGDGRLNSPHSEEVKIKISQTKKMQNLSIQHTEETKYKLREINKGQNNPMYGRHHTDEVKEQQSIRIYGINHPMYGKKHDTDTILKIKKNRKLDQSKLNDISRQNSSKSVLQFDLSGNFIKEYESIKVASYETGLSESLIGKTCRGVVRNPKKFIFKFKHEESKVMNNSFKIKIGDEIIIEDKKYILIKRNKQSFIVNNDSIYLSFRRKEYDFIWEKSESRKLEAEI